MREQKQRAKYRAKRKLLFLFFIFIGIFTYLSTRIVHINQVIGKEDRYKQIVMSQQLSKTYGLNTSIKSKRGSIQDRNGTVFAESIRVYHVIFDPGVVSVLEKEQREHTINYVHEQLGFSKEELIRMVDENSSSHYKKIMSNLSYDEIKQVLDDVDKKLVKGINIEEDYQRYYPNQTLASHVVGFSSKDNEGRWGIEAYYNNELQGMDGRHFSVFDDDIKPKEEVKQPVSGHDIVLTLDQTVQYNVEKAIDNFLTEYDALRVSAIVMNPNNGEVLAMASYPNYDLSQPYDLSKYYTKQELDQMTLQEKDKINNSLWRNPVISDTYEPGSTFKPVTLAIALEEGRVSLDDTYYCSGSKRVYDWNIKCWKEEGHGEQTLFESLANSCNVAFMEIIEKIGVDHFYNYLKLFGFGTQTNIDAYGEAVGKLYEKNKIGPVELATHSFGQAFNVTPIQLVSAFNALINGGYLYEPYLVKKVISEDNQLVHNHNKTLIRQVISSETSDLMKQALRQVVDSGTGKTAQLEGYITGGKTGEAEKLPRDEDKTIISFIGFAPYDNPKVVTFIMVDELEVDNPYSAYAAKIYVEIMNNILPYMNIYPTS